MEKFLFYGASTSSMTCIPAHRLSEIQRYDDTNIFINHELPSSSTVGSNSEYSVNLIVNGGKANKVINTISKAINNSKDPFIVVLDKIAGTPNLFIDADITDMGTLDPIS